jgi:hypothetical protein
VDAGRLAAGFRAGVDGRAAFFFEGFGFDAPRADAAGVGFGAGA